MRILAHSIAFGAVLIFGVSSGAWAQDQPPAGSPPPTATAPAQTQNAAPPQAQAPAATQNAAPAQDTEMPPPPPDARRAPNPHRQARVMARKLGLTAEQEAAIEPILANRDRRMERVRSNAMLAPRDRRVRVRRITRESVENINAVLSDAQRQQYRQLRQDQRARRRERAQQRLEVPPPANNQ
ncbi:MAG: hypothetical protein WAM66_13280 [Acidobacteriaceae bacterium]